jgi:glycosyltransferase involved in cell wall biosynthesis
VPTHLLAKLYKASDVFLFTSYAESFGLPPLEAMACGTPVIMTDAKGTRDYAVNYSNAIVVNPGDSQAIAEAAYQVLINEALRRKLIEGGLETAKEWSWDVKFPLVERFYCELLDSA